MKYLGPKSATKDFSLGPQWKSKCSMKHNVWHEGGHMQKYKKYVCCPYNAWMIYPIFTSIKWYDVKMAIFIDLDRILWVAIDLYSQSCIVLSPWQIGESKKTFFSCNLDNGLILSDRNVVFNWSLFLTLCTMDWYCQTEMSFQWLCSKIFGSCIHFVSMLLYL